MNKFIINKNEYLDKKISGYFHTDYLRYRQPGNPDYLNHLKNTFGDTVDMKLNNAMEDLYDVFKEDLNRFNRSLTVCVVPRSKAINSYNENQLLFRKVLKKVVKEFNFKNGLKYITRHTDTKTTHLSHTQYAGDGSMPYPGITKDTCDISYNVMGKDILLIDDIYTTNVNIDEDVIQALFDNGANSVIFYAVGKTI